MSKYSFLYPVLFCLTLLGFGLELSVPYLDSSACCIFTCSDVEQEQEDFKGHTKPSKNDEDRQIAVFLTIVFLSDTETRRSQAPYYAQGALPHTFLAIFSPPPEPCAVCDAA